MSEREPGIEEELLEAVLHAWAQNPSMRFGQLVVNAIRPKDPCSEIYNIEDSQLIKRLKRLF